MINREDLLELCLEELEAGVPLADLLLRLPDEAEELKSLLVLAAAMRDLPQPEAAPVKSAPLWQKLAGIFTNGFWPKEPQRRYRFSLSDSQAQATSGQSPEAKAPPRRYRFGPLTGLARLATSLAMLAGLVIAVGAAVLLNQTPVAQAAIITELSGQVEVAEAPGQAWQPLAAGAKIQAGQRLRTGEASLVRLTFPDGSSTRVYANSDLTLASLANSPTGLSAVRLIQHLGHTAHIIVAHQSEATFSIETPAGVASVQGTAFNVFVNPNGQARFAVETGQVRLEAQGEAILLSAGQVSVASPGHTPGLPANEFQEQGLITAQDRSEWVIGGLPIRVSDETAIQGQPKVGATVNVLGRVLANGVWLADIVEVVAAQQPTASFTGIVQAIGPAQWNIGGVLVAVGDQTVYDAALRTGTKVRVTFQMLEDGRRQALHIETLESERPVSVEQRPSLSFEPDELLVVGCANQFKIVGHLLNDGEPPSDDVAGVQLVHQVTRGAEFMPTVQIDPESWDVIQAGEGIHFTLTLNLNEQWASAAEGNEVKVQIQVGEAAEPAGQSPARLTVTVVRRCQTPPTATASPTATEGVSTATPVPPTFTTGPVDSPVCLGAANQAMASALAEQFKVPYAEIASWFCAGFGFGEIRLAYEISLQTGIPAEEIFTLRQTGMGWGEIMIQLGILPGVIPPVATPTDGPPPGGNLPTAVPTEAGPPPGVPGGPPTGIPRP